MTLTPCDLALAAIAAPEPESRFTSSSTFAPLVIACSACCCCVDLSPSALVIVGFDASGRRTPSSGAAGRPSPSAPTTSSPAAARRPCRLAASLAARLLLSLLLLSSLPQAATRRAGARRRLPPAASALCCLANVHVLLLVVVLTSDAAPGTRADLGLAAGHERERAEHLRSLSQHACHDRASSAAAGSASRPTASRIGVEQDVARLAQVAARRRPCSGLKHVAAGGHHPAEHPPGVGDRPLAAGVAVAGQPMHLAHAQLLAAAPLQQVAERRPGDAASRGSRGCRSGRSGPSRSTSTWPISPGHAAAAAVGRPSTIRPAPMPDETIT